jgi:hypothetical protein
VQLRVATGTQIRFYAARGYDHVFEGDIAASLDA